jgi:hypothetical protein
MTPLTLIPITEKLPADDQDVIVWNGSKLAAAKYIKLRYLKSEKTLETEMRGVFQVEKYPGDMDRSITSLWNNVTHWMPANIENPNGNI